MESTKFNSLEDVFEYYGRENIVAIDFLPQLIFYTKKGAQPVFVYENELKPGKITGWFLKSKTADVYRQWLASKPRKN